MEGAMEQHLWSLQDAKNRFSAVVKAAAKGTPQTVTKHGKPTVVVLSVDDYERLTSKAGRDRPSFVEHLLAIPKGPVKIERAQIKMRDVKF
jgi:antitoxin Phd